MSNELTLAITTIGDLLQKNKITNCGNGKALENIKLTIPNYQRPYKWTAKNANQLYLDASGKISRISVASLKFMIMLQICKDGQWRFEEIQNHQHKMVCRLCDISEEE